MDEKMDQIPALGTKAAAVAAIESMMFRAIGAKDLEPLQLRYWLDAYYQARKAAEGVIEMRKAPQPTAPLPITLGGSEKWSDDGVLRWYYVKPLREDPVIDEKPGYNVILRRTEDGELEFERVDGTPHQSAAPTASPQGEAPSAEIQVDQFGFEKEGDGAAVSAPPEQADASDGQEDTSSVTAEAVTPSPQVEGQSEPKAKRQRPVSWTDDFEPVERKKSGAAEAAAYKREVLARLQEIRSRGVTVPQIVKVAEGNITEDQVRAILEARRVPVAVYRVLSAALDQIDK